MVASESPAADASDPAAVWRTLLDTVGRSNAAAWLDLFELRSIDTDPQPALATLAAKPGQAHAPRFATAPRLERLGHHLGNIIGRPVRVTLAAAVTPDPVAGSDDHPPSPASGSPGSVDRREALNLPVVRDAFEIFPDAMLLDARKEAPDPTDGASSKY